MENIHNYQINWEKIFKARSSNNKEFYKLVRNGLQENVFGDEINLKLISSKTKRMFDEFAFHGLVEINVQTPGQQINENTIEFDKELFQKIVGNIKSNSSFTKIDFDDSQANVYTMNLDSGNQFSLNIVYEDGTEKFNILITRFKGLDFQTKKFEYMLLSLLDDSED